MVGCSAYGCSSRSERKEPGITFHRFPLKHPKRLSLWVEKLHLSDWVVTKNDRLCSKHFEVKSFYHIGEKICLLDDAVPTIFPELPKYLQDKPKPKRATKRSRQDMEQPSLSIEQLPGPSDVCRQQQVSDVSSQKLRIKLINVITKSPVKSKKY